MDKPTENKPKWEEELWGLLYNEYGDVGQNGNIKTFIQDQIEEAYETARQIFIKEVDWAEWGIEDKEAGEIFDEKFNDLINNNE